MHVESFKVKTVCKEYYVEIITVSTKYHKFQLTSGGSVGVFHALPQAEFVSFFVRLLRAKSFKIETGCECKHIMLKHTLWCENIPNVQLKVS